MDIVKQPPAIHTGFNPAILSIKPELNEYQITIGINVDDEVFLRTREPMNDRLDFDLSPIVKTMFVGSRTDLVPDIAFKDTLFALDYKVIVNESVLLFTSINAVAQIGESSDLSVKMGTFCTKFERLKRYDGYELTVGYIGFNKNTSIKYKDTIVAETDSAHACVIVPDAPYISISTSGTFEPLTTNQSVAITNNRGEPILVRDMGGVFEQRFIHVDSMCTPSNPFYIRWVNQQGGYDYWMFSHRQFITRNVENQEMFRPAIFDQQTAVGYSQLIGLEAVEKITVGSSNVTKNEYDCISKLIYSRHKEWYNEAIGRWVTIQLDKGENINDTRAELKHLEFTFILPEVQTQF